MANNKVPTSPKENEVGDSQVYSLSFIKGNIQQTRLLQITAGADMEMPEVVERAKSYCKTEGLRFVFITPAITTISREA